MSKTNRAVTELDFRMPEFRDAKAEDYEFRDDGKIVRKDRWEKGIRSVAFAVGFTGRKEWEIEDVVDRVRELAGGEEEWIRSERIDWNDIPQSGRVDLRLEDGSLLSGAIHERKGFLLWQGSPVTVPVTFVKVL
ncbi:hypothetical protein OIU34_22570 [Pararhizobium sp. BT-229]|uniref:hypothetical protein n=1 Tax=Pararhizobium sp. BT-229 TaxID=2986923 RepID=UPI0021F7F449|nr:hypothetical protein [Pararhizobium sp. BT-229]MCV9964678.1 hypothetical protein [Pararhizobium sp. BT-229]